MLWVEADTKNARTLNNKKDTLDYTLGAVDVLLASKAYRTGGT